MSSNHPPSSISELHISEDSSPSRIPNPTPAETQRALRKALFEVHCPHRDEPGKKKKRNLIVTIDGISNQFSVNSSNVAQLFSQIIKVGGDVEQLVFHNGGIGIYARPSLRSFSHWKQVIYNHIDTAIAWNFERIIHAAYKWLSENYQPGDRIFLFGFSRGAYQVRVIAGMIELVGLLHRGNENQIPFVYELYTAMTAHSKRGSGPRTFRSRVSDEEQLCQTFKKSLCHELVKVHFVGAWDTVSSIGVLRGKALPESLSGMNRVCHFRHALALDERRATFQPEYVNGGDGPTDGESRADVKEVWFKGTHSDIGGGNMPNKHLHNFGDSLQWMTYEARACGLLMTEYMGKWVPVKVQESLTWGWVFLELLPFRALSYEGKDSVTWRPHLGRARKIRPGQRIHQSVFSTSSSGSEVNHEETALSRKISQVLPKRKTAAATYLPKAALPKLTGYTELATWEALFSDYHSLGVFSMIDIETDPFTEAAQSLMSLAGVCLTIEHGDPGTYRFQTMLGTICSFLNHGDAISVETRLASLCEVPDAGGILLTAMGVAVNHQALDTLTLELKETLVRLLSQTRLVPTTARLPTVSQVYKWGSDILHYREDFFKVLQQFAYLGHHQGYNYILDVAFWPLDPQKIVFTSSPGRTTSVLIWEGSIIQDPQEIANVQGGNSTISCDGSHVAVTGGMSVSIIDTTTQLSMVVDCTDNEKPSGNRDIGSLCFTHDNQTLASGYNDGWVKVWQREADQWKLSHSFQGGDHGIHYLAFSEDGSRLAFAEDLGSVKVWSLADEVLIELDDSQENSVSLLWNHAGTWIISGTVYGIVKIWSPSHGAIEGTFQAHESTVRCLAFPGDEHVLATGGMDGWVRIWKYDSRTWVNLWEFDIGDWVASVAFSPDGQRLVCGGYHGTIHLRDVDSQHDKSKGQFLFVM